MVNIDDAAGAKLSEQMIATIHKKDFESDYLTKKESGAKLIDIRTQAEYDAGHYEGASMIDFYKSDFKSNLAKLDKATPYYIYCRSGNRSGQALQIMRGLGFKEVYDLAGGMSMASDILKIVK
jgi:rhodanese-related sulfurtransferase